MVVYNGFSDSVRNATNKPQREGRRDGSIPDHMTCCVTGFSMPDDPKGKGYIFLHLEDYRYPTSDKHIYPMSKQAHAALHARFYKPTWWSSLVLRNYVHGAWFTFLTWDKDRMDVPFDKLYPHGLPPDGELWPDMADDLGISQELFNHREYDLRGIDWFSGGVPEEGETKDEQRQLHPFLRKRKQLKQQGRLNI